MKVLIVSTIVPFIEGGGTFIVNWLEQTLKKYGHTCDVLKLPFHSYYPVMLEQMLALRLLDVRESADRMIAIRTPSYLLEHPHKVLWFIHHHRGAYDLWGTPYQDIPDNAEGLRIREVIMHTDQMAFSEAKKIFTNSQTVSNRLKKFNQIDSEVLYPPLLNPDSYFCRAYEDFIFYPSRMTSHKRQALAVEAMKYTKSGVKLILAGSPENQGYIETINAQIVDHRLQDKVQMVSRWISEEEKRDFFSRCLACIYIPYDEDSYGYPSLESFHSHKPVVTCSDSGGTLELIQDAVNGRIVSSDPRELAEVFDQLYLDKAQAKRMGESGFRRLNELNINWDHVVERLLA